MKNILVSILLILPILCSAQSGPVSFSEVIPVEGASKEELFIRARAWFAESFTDSKSVLQINDKESGELVGKALFGYTSGVFMGSGARQGHIKYTIKILVKDGRYKYVIEDFIHEASPYNKMPDSWGLLEYGKVMKGRGGKGFVEKVMNEMIDMSNRTAQSLIVGLVKTMNKPSDLSKDNDW